MPTVLSAPAQLSAIATMCTTYLRTPFATDVVPGAVLEHILAHVREGTVLATYDFADVLVTTKGWGWQVKSTKEDTPVTWKRAKLPNRQKLIAASRKSEAAREELGASIIDFCNEHARESMRRYGLKSIGYARLVMHADRFLYFERELLASPTGSVFTTTDFEWAWSRPKKTAKKEQLQAFHGIHIPTGEKWFAWHGLGENQLHFSGERAWWPAPGGANSVTVPLPGPAERLSLSEFIQLMADYAAQ